MSVVELNEDSAAESAQQSRESTSRPANTRRRRLSQEEQRQIAQLYAETSTPMSEIRERFGIGDSSLYRVVQRHGVALRGRSASPAPQAAQPVRTPTTRRRRAASTAAGRPRRTPAASAPSASTTRSRDAGAARQQFRIHYEAQTVFEATDISDALRQAALLGATEITEVVRQG